MKCIRFDRPYRRWTQRAGILTMLALWSGAALSLPDNPKDPPLPPSSMGEMYEDSNARRTVRRFAQGQDCPGMVGSLRLLDGATTNEGRLEICADVPNDGHGPLWGVICDDYWTDEDSGVACRQLGYKREESPSGRFLKSFFGAGTGPFMLDDMWCSTSETQLLDCLVGNRTMTARTMIGVHNCRKNETVGVRCLTTTGDATLRDLSVQHGSGTVTIVPGPGNSAFTSFTPGLYNYFTQTPVPASISNVTVYADKNDPNASVEYFDSSRTLLGSGPSLNIPSLAMGLTQIEVQITADDGTILTYSVDIDRR